MDAESQNDPPAPDPPSKKKPYRQLVVGGVGVVALFLAWRFLPVGAWLSDFNEWVGTLGAVGLLLFAAVYVLSTILLLPGAILTIGAGFAFGLVGGFIAVSVGSTVGAALAFLIGRFFARERIKAMTRDKPKFQRVD